MARGFSPQGPYPKAQNLIQSVVKVDMDGEKTDFSWPRWFWKPPSGTSLSSTAASEPAMETRESVHLQLEELKPKEEQEDKNNNKTVTVLTYTEPDATKWTALSTAPHRFRSFLKYRGISDAMKVSLTTTDLEEQTPEIRQQWRQLWREERLLTDRTELLAVFPSDKTEKGSNKRGGFADHLSLYVDRFLSILSDEADSGGGAALLEWLQSSYSNASLLELESFQALSERRQLDELKTFLEWFRNQFPYFHDRCLHCGVSVKEENARRAEETTENPKEDDQSFVGFVFPNATERIGKASRTELYLCPSCGEFTRFARYNSAMHVVDQRRGRCGEYSVLLYQMLRVLGHEARWVVDWADHVWAEISMTRLDGRTRWVHLDPCEASVDENLLYQGWGKKQTYILSFYTPNGQADVAAIEDVTEFYTDDKWKAIKKRREDPETQVLEAIRNADNLLRNKLQLNNLTATN